MSETTEVIGEVSEKNRRVIGQDQNYNRRMLKENQQPLPLSFRSTKVSNPNLAHSIQPLRADELFKSATSKDKSKVMTHLKVAALECKLGIAKPREKSKNTILMTRSVQGFFPNKLDHSVSKFVGQINFKKQANRDYCSGKPVAPLQKMILEFKASMSTPVRFPSVKKESLKIEDFEVGPCLGKGQFGEVLAVRHKATKSIFAMKRISKDAVRESGMVDQLVCEMRIQYMLSHPNIIRLYGHFDDWQCVYLLMEFAPGGNLMHQLRKSEEEAAKLLSQLLPALAHAHQKHIIHRDIKPENIVMCLSGTPKLCDFGLSAYLGDGDASQRSTFCGTLDYVSPQMKESGSYSYSVDIWSLGILTYEMLVGAAPFREEIEHWRRRGGRRQSNWNWIIDYPHTLSVDAVSLMQNLLKKNPCERFSIFQCMESGLLRRYHRKSPQTVLDLESKMIL